MNTSTNPYAIVDNLPVDLGSCVLSIRLSTEKNMKIDIVSHQPFNFWVGGAMLYRILFSQECKPLFIPLSFFVWPLHYLSFFVWPLHYLSFLDLATTLSVLFRLATTLSVLLRFGHYIICPSSFGHYIICPS
jgi:hypothetical protein